MPNFSDASGCTWEVTLTVEQIRRVRQSLGYDLAKLFTPERLGELGEDVVLQVDVLAELTAEQRKLRGVSDAEFGAAMRGQVLEDAIEALLEAAVDFLPRSRGEVMTRVKAKAAELQGAMLQTMLAQVDALTIEDLRQSSRYGERSSE